MLEVTHAQYLNQFRIHVRFNSGEEGVVDLADALWGPVFQPLRDPTVFCRFEVSAVLHTIKWDNDADFAPEFLYQKMIDQASSRECHEAPRELGS